MTSEDLEATADAMRVGTDRHDLIGALDCWQKAACTTGITAGDKHCLAGMVADWIANAENAASLCAWDRRLILLALEKAGQNGLDIQAAKARLEEHELAERPGRVALLVAAQDGSFATCLPLDVTTDARGGAVRFLPLPGQSPGNCLIEHFGYGAVAALRWIINRGPEGLGFAVSVWSRSYVGTIGSFPGMIDGPSIGLAAAVATVSSSLDIPVPVGTAFTGCIDLKGSVCAVGQMEAKLVAAERYGFDAVYVPKEGGVPERFKNKEWLRPVGTVAEVIENLFDEQTRARRIALLVSKQVVASPYVEELTRRISSDRREKWLLSCVGARDPFGKVAGEAGRPAGAEDGPLVTAARWLDPVHVLLFHTCTGENDFTDKASEIAKVLGDSKVDCRKLDGVTDPTDYEQLVPALRKGIADALSAAEYDGKRIQLFVNLSSGSPQMETIWHLLVEAGVLPEAYRLQVSRWLKEGESRVRPANPPRL